MANSQLTIVKCPKCKQFKPDGRSDRRYCSDACRQSAYRLRQWKKQQLVAKMVPGKKQPKAKLLQKRKTR